MSVRYYIGYGLVLLSRASRALLLKAFRIASLPEKFSVIVWTSREIDRFSMADWDSRSAVDHYSRLDKWLDDTEKNLVAKYFWKHACVLNVACGAGREALLLTKQGMNVTATDWGSHMVSEGRRRALEAGLSIRFAVADMFNLPFGKEVFDCMLLTNIAYSYLFPRNRRIRFLRQAHCVLKSGGVFIISFALIHGDTVPAGALEPLFRTLRLWPPFNREYETGDLLAGTFSHTFRPEQLREEFEEAQFVIKDQVWDQGYAVLVKL